MTLNHDCNTSIGVIWFIQVQNVHICCDLRLYDLQLHELIPSSGSFGKAVKCPVPLN